jgi:uncharacterized protein YndB with AHSA1/START domain
MRRLIKAPPDRLFRAWTSAAELTKWWAPRNVLSAQAEIDARLGGQYRIDNQMVDGRTVSIVGEIDVYEPPHRLGFTWRLEPTGVAGATAERVRVSFEHVGEATAVVVVHDRIPRPEIRDDHLRGWAGCLDGLEIYAARHE